MANEASARPSWLFPLCVPTAIPHHLTSVHPPQLCSGGEDREEGWSHVSTRHVTHQHPHHSQTLSYSLWNNKELCLLGANTLKLQMILTDASHRGKGALTGCPPRPQCSAQGEYPFPSNQMNHVTPKSCLSRAWPFPCEKHKQVTFKPLVNMMVIKMHIRGTGTEPAWGCQVHSKTGTHFSSGEDRVALEGNLAHCK